MDAITVGNMLMYGAMLVPKSVTTGERIKFPANKVTHGWQ